MAALACITLLICHLLVRNLLGLKPLSNNGIFFGLWTALLFLHALNLSTFPPLSIQTGTFLILFFCIYTLTSIGYGKVLQAFIHKRNRPNRTQHSSVEKKMPAWMPILFVCAWALTFAQYLLVVSKEISLAFFLTGGAARSALSGSDEISITYYIPAYFYLAVAFRPCKSEIANRALLNNTTRTIVLVSLLFTAAKINFVSGAFLLYIGWFKKEKYSSSVLAKHSLAALALLYLFVATFAIFTGKVIDENVGSLSGVQDLFKLGLGALLYPYDYAVGSIAALDEIFRMSAFNSAYATGGYSVPVLYKIASTFGFTGNTKNLPPQFMEFVYINGVWTNVYTMFLDLIYDFGVYGSLLAAPALAVLNASLDSTERGTTSASLALLNACAKLSIFLSFINFRYGGTLFIAALIFYLSANSFLFIAYKRRTSSENKAI